MATHDPAPTDEAAAKAAVAELDRLTAAFRKAEDDLEKARTPVHEAIVRHLHARSAPPGLLADHTPYDRNHVGRLGKAAGVPPLRGPNAAPAPEYNDATQAAALAELDKLTAAFRKAEGKVEDARKPLHEAIARIYAARTLGPGVIAEHVPYDRNHVGRIVKAAGAPLIRG
ncbi:hypothetical protein [Streptomyces sp. NBC_01233]|uniref:hypothetical protein n=1 Tax=Streptomyces sp. NBC_01233 TaxID=2903787 RepID=UPI002E10DCAF|nr:hypothetical protein OG332_24160 [Streptomyces sp. NBC_01233]